MVKVDDTYTARRLWLPFLSLVHSDIWFLVFVILPYSMKTWVFIISAADGLWNFSFNRYKDSIILHSDVLNKPASCFRLVLSKLPPTDLYGSQCLILERSSHGRVESRFESRLWGSSLALWLQRKKQCVYWKIQGYKNKKVLHLHPPSISC